MRPSATCWSYAYRSNRRRHYNDRGPVWQNRYASNDHPEIIKENGERFKAQLGRFIDFTTDNAIMANNADWLMNLEYIPFLREIGMHFSVNRMLTAECFKSRMEKVYPS